MKRLYRVSLPVAVLLALATLFASGDHALAQRVSTQWNGSIEARFDNGCAVHYDSRGRRVGSSSRCSRNQIRDADAAVAAYLDRGQDGGWNEPPPRVVVHGNGAGEVRFRGACTVFYKRNGDRDRADPACNRDQRRLADDAMARYRREQGLDRPAGGSGGGAPRATILETGYGLVTFGDGCRVHYGLDGRRRDAGRRCTADQIARADEAMRRHREGLGYGSGNGRWRPGGDAGDLRPREISVDRDGRGRVTFRGGCAVTYDRRGRRDSSSRDCTADQIARADREMASYRRENDLN